LKLTDTIKLIPGYDPYRDAGDCTFDEALAQKCIDFFPEMLKHVEGELATQPLVIEPWFQAVVANAFGWMKPDGTRRYREVFIYVPRKNSKSTSVSGLVNLVFFLDKEAGGQIYLGASSRKQAGIVFSIAKRQVLLAPRLKARCNVGAHKVTDKTDEGTYYEPLSAEAGTAMGLNIHCAAIDELHTHANGDFIEAIQTGTVARRQPILFYLTTADYQRESICNQMYDYACQVRDGNLKDPNYLPVIYEADPEDDWTAESTWKKANPMYGLSVKADYMKRECLKAQASPIRENGFKRLHLNIRTEAVDRYFNMFAWDSCSSVPQLVAGDDNIRKWLSKYGTFKAELLGQRCYGGLDLASSKDLSAFSLYFPQEDGTNKVLMWFWIPREQAKIREKSNNIPYTLWEKLGLVKIIPGEVTDPMDTAVDVAEICEKYDVRMIGADPRFNAESVLQYLIKQDIEVEKIFQSFTNLSRPTKVLERRVTAKTIDHGSNPVLAWNAASTNVKHGPDSMLRPVKPDSTEANKIDGIVALIMAIAEESNSHADDSKKTVYDKRDVRFI
jgi:phage terminase large subunit-like protein